MSRLGQPSYNQVPMLESTDRVWSRHPVGFRRGELDEGDGLAAMVVTLIGGPALLVGAVLVTTDNLSLFQVLFLAPLAAILGGVVVGASARMAASTGGTGTWLLRPSFGVYGSWGISVLRFAMVVAWAIVGLQVAGEWGDGVVTAAGFGLGGADGVIAILGLLALLAMFIGPLASIRFLVRRPLFWASVALVAVVAWQVGAGGGFDSGPGGSFWAGLQRAVEMAAIFVPFAQTVARRLRDDEDAITSFGVGYTIPATLTLVAGAIFAERLADFGDLTGLTLGTTGVALAAAWVIVAEVDQAFSAFLAAGSEATGIIGALPPVIVGGLTSVGIVAAAIFLPTLSIGLASLLSAVVFPAALIAAADFFLARDRHYSEAEIYGATAGESALNVVGVTTWLLAVILGQVIDPIGPGRWTAAMPELTFSGDLPWRLLMAIVGAVAYLVLVRWRDHRAAAVYDLRGV